MADWCISKGNPTRTRRKHASDLKSTHVFSCVISHSSKKRKKRFAQLLGKKLVRDSRSLPQDRSFLRPVTVLAPPNKETTKNREKNNNKKILKKV